jgi:hypothetical protein
MKIKSRFSVHVAATSSVATATTRVAKSWQFHDMLRSLGKEKKTMIPAATCTHTIEKF